MQTLEADEVLGTDARPPVLNPGKGKKPLRAQKPIATRDNRKPAQIRASIQLGPSLETRAGLFKDAIEDKPYASRKFTFDELEPQAHDVDALMQQADAGREKSEDEKARDQEHLERRVMLPQIVEALSRIDCQGCRVGTPSGAWVVFKGCNRSAAECCCQADPEMLQTIKNNNLKKDEVLAAISRSNMLRANLDKEERRVYREWGWRTSEYDPKTTVCDGDMVERGLQPKDHEAVTAPQLRLPAISSTSAWDPILPCVFNAHGCKGKGFQVQMLSQVHDVHFKQTGDREAADRVVIKMVTDMCQPCGTKAYEGLQFRVGTSISCTNGECKLRAGIISEDWMNEFCQREDQGANEINGNIRYQSDKFFLNDLKLARRLFEEPKYRTFGEREARRMVADTAQFSYYAESREREAIGTTFAFVEALEALGVPWDHSTKQEFLDRAKMVPRNHIITTVADHVVTKQKDRFGVAGKRGWEPYLKVIIGKWMFPEPLTGICLLLRLKNWEANGKPILDGRLVDRISSNHPATGLFGSALEFHNVLYDYIDAASKTPYRLEYTGTDASLCAGTNTGSYWTTMQNITKATGKSSALMVSLVARFMEQHGRSAAHQTQMSQVHINGDYYAPPCADLFGNNNVTTWERYVFYATAYGLGADYKVGYLQTGTAPPFGTGAEVKLDNFITDFMPTLFLEKCKDKRGSAAGYRIVPSQLIDKDFGCLPKHHVPSGGGATSGPLVKKKTAAAAVDAAQYAHWHRSEPLGSPTRGVPMFAALLPFAGVPSGAGMSRVDPDDTTKRIVNLVPIYEMPDGGAAAFPKLAASADQAKERVLAEYNTLVYKEQVLDPDITALDDYCRKDVDNRLMLWAIGRERYKKHWYKWLKDDRPEQFAELVRVGTLSANWIYSMNEDPGGTADGRFKVKDDYDAYVKEERHKAHRAFALEEEWFKDHPLEPEPTHFGYFCSMQKIDPDERWPTMRSLRLQYAEKQMLYHESELLKLRDGVPGDKRGSLAEAINKERKTELQRLRPKATQAEKDRALEAPREMSELHAERLRVYNLKSKRLDRVLKPRYGRWQFERDNLQFDEEREQVEAIDEAFENHIDDRFDGGLAHELERRRAELTKHAFKRDDRALARAELELTRQEAARKLDDAEKNHKHERPEAMAIERATERFLAAENDDDEGDKGVDPVISNRLEDMQLSNITNERKHARKAVEVTTKPDEIAKESLEFPANGDYACRSPAQLDAPYSNPRLRGLDWIDEDGHDKYVGSAKRAKR